MRKVLKKGRRAKGVVRYGGLSQEVLTFACCQCGEKWKTDEWGMYADIIEASNCLNCNHRTYKS